MDSASAANIGRRLVAVEIDAIARDDPDRAWASVPIDDENLARGYKTVTYKQFSNAISHAARWLSCQLTGERPAFETVAYGGPNDLRYPVIAVAALKCGKKRHLLDVTSCTTYLHAASFASTVKSITSAGDKALPLQVPGLEKWLYGNKGPVFPYSKSWDEAQSDPWLIFHTSGTTGMPKPFTYTNRMMTSFNAAELMPDANRETINDLFRNQRFYVAVPPLHFVGMTAALQWTVFLNMVNVQNALGPPTPARVLEILRHGQVEGVVMPPSLIQGIVREPAGLEALRRLSCVYFAGAPIPDHVAAQLTFMGVELQKRTETLHELVFVRRREFERWQQLFKVYPGLEEFPTKDLWSPHPSKPDLWKYARRADDLFKLDSGHGLHVTEMEVIIQKHLDIRTAIIGGEGRPRPFVVVDFYENCAFSSEHRGSKLAQIWPAIQEANETCSDYMKLTEPLILFASAAKPLPLTAKDTVLRPSALSLYKEEIDEMYKASRCTI